MVQHKHALPQSCKPKKKCSSCLTFKCRVQPVNTQKQWGHYFVFPNLFIDISWDRFSLFIQGWEESCDKPDLQTPEYRNCTSKHHLDYKLESMFYVWPHLERHNKKLSDGVIFAQPTPYITLHILCVHGFLLICQISSTPGTSLWCIINYCHLVIVS